jgi:hypothetical protein
LGGRALPDRKLPGEAADRCLSRGGDLDEQEELVLLGGQAVLPDYPFALGCECSEGQSKVGSAAVIVIGEVFSRNFVCSK